MKLTEEDCKDAILQHVNENCCYGTKPAKEMTITKIEGITALHVSRIHLFHSNRLLRFRGDDISIN